jgi:mRNA interferase MazF
VAKPQRGEIWLVDLGYVAKVRPCLVMSIPFSDTERSLVTLVPHTTSTRDSRFEVVLNLQFLREGAFDAQSVVTVPSVKLIRKLGVVNQSEMAVVQARVALWLGFGS